MNFSKGLYVELQPFGVRVTCIIPGCCSTGFQASSGIDEVTMSLKTKDIADSVVYACELPAGAVVEEMTVWGTSQVVSPL